MCDGIDVQKGSLVFDFSVEGKTKGGFEFNNSSRMPTYRSKTLSGSFLVREAALRRGHCQ
jgi:hypothetical protein